MGAIQLTCTFVSDASSQLILQYSARYNQTEVPLQLTGLMQFIYEYEDALTKDEESFLYFLTRATKKFTFQDRFIYGIKNDSDILDCFLYCKQYRFPCHIQQATSTKLLDTHSALPITIQVKKSGFALQCQLMNASFLLADPTRFLLLHKDSQTFVFSNGIFREIPSKFEPFLNALLDQDVVTFKSNTDISAFIKHIHGPSGNLVEWLLQVSLDQFMPDEVVPSPLLTLQYEQQTLTPLLSYEYGNAIIDSSYQDPEVIDKRSGKRMSRLMDMESIYQDDLMDLFHAHQLPFLLTNPGDIAAFLDKVIPELKRRDWKINSNVGDFTVLDNTVDLEFSVESSSKDWFHFEPNTTLMDQSVSLQEIAKLALQNHGYVKTKKGFVKLSKHSQDQLQFLTKNGAFKVGKTFNKRDILPLVSATSVKTKSPDLSTMIQTMKGLSPSTMTLSPDFKGELRDYQVYGVHWLQLMYHSSQGALLADDMGLGKTIQLLAFSSLLDTTSPTLVVCPTSVTYNWKKEIKTFLPGQTSVVYGGANRFNNVEKLSSYDYIIVSYGILKNDIEWLKSLHYGCIIVDEAQMIKNPNAQVSKAVKLLQGDFKCAMTGTPIENHLQDIWNLFDFVMPGYLGTKSQFDSVIKDMQLDALRSKVKPFICRREKRDVLDSLPDKTEVVIKCPLSPEQMQLYKEVLDATKKGIEASKNQRNKLPMLTALLKLRQVCTHPGMIEGIRDLGVPSAKFDVIKSKCLELMDEGHKVVLFSQFTSMLDIIETWTTKEGLPIERIDGSITGKKRMEAVDRFQTKEGPCLFLISLKAGGVGLNLTAADYVIHVDPWWNPAIEAQATDRVHRMGQKNKVIVYKFICEGTIEETIQTLQDEKRQLLNEIVDVDGISEKNIDLDQVKELVFG